MFNDIFSDFNINIDCGESHSICYDKIIDLASVIFTSNKYDNEEKKELYLRIQAIFNG